MIEVNEVISIKRVDMLKKRKSHLPAMDFDGAFLLTALLET